MLDKARFRASFAADVEPRTAQFMADSQVPWSVAALEGAVTVPAWKSKPSWYLVATDDHMIPPPAQRDMAKRAGATVKEVKGSHAVYVSNPPAVANLIGEAAASAHKSFAIVEGSDSERALTALRPCQCSMFTMQPPPETTSRGFDQPFGC
jgi:hypothetical protein